MKDKKIALTVRYHLFPEETMICAEQAGFRYVCMGLGETDVFEKDDWEDKIGALSEALSRHHLCCTDVHLPVYDLRISGEYTDCVTDRSMLRCLRAAKLLGADVCAYHARSHFFDGKLDRRASLDDNLHALEPLVREAERQDVAVGVENLLPDFYGGYPEELFDMIDNFDSPHICALWDTGHANLMPFDQADALRSLGSRVRATHIHDNMKNYDAHNPPSMGNINWDAVLGALQKIGYSGYLTLESFYYHGPMTDLYIRHLYECVERLWDKMQEIRE